MALQSNHRRLRTHSPAVTESILDAVLKDLRSRRTADWDRLAIEDLCTADYFTAVRLNDGSQGAAINFNNVPGPHRAEFDAEFYDRELMRQIARDPLLLQSHLTRSDLDYLGISIRVAILNALSESIALGPCDAGLVRCDGYLDLAARLRPGDSVAMIGCTGNYSCPEIGKLDFLAKVEFSDFEYSGPFKSGIEDCIRQFFRKPEIVALSDGSRNREICSTADAVVIIADTLCTNTLDELLAWSLGAREVLITGRSYAMNPMPLFDRGATGVCSQRIVEPDLIGFIRRKIARGETGFTDSLVTCFERVYYCRAAE